MTHDPTLELRRSHLPANRQLWQALEAGQVTGVVQALKAGAHPDAYGENGQDSPLYFAIRRGLTTLALCLVKAGASPGCLNEAQIPWLACVASDNPKVFNELAQRHTPTLRELDKCLAASLGVVSVLPAAPVAPAWTARLLELPVQARWSSDNLCHILMAYGPRNACDNTAQKLAHGLHLIREAGVVSREPDGLPGFRVNWATAAMNLMEWSALHHPAVVSALAFVLDLTHFRAYLAEPDSPPSATFQRWFHRLELAQLHEQVPAVESQATGPRL